MDKSVLGVILLDVSPGVGEQFDQSFLERVDHPVIVCHGPHEGELYRDELTGVEVRNHEPNVADRYETTEQ